MVHCAAGKDRTGIVVALLLDLCGVPKEDIIKDYSASENYLQVSADECLLGNTRGMKYIYNILYIHTFTHIYIIYTFPRYEI